MIRDLDLAVDGTSFALISKTALDHYRLSLAQQRYSQADFEVTERVDPPPRSTSDTWGFVIVTCKSCGVERRYRAGPSLRWTDAFDADISRGVCLPTSADLPTNVAVLRARRAG